MHIYMTTSERTALSAVDSRKLDELLDKAVDEERSGCLGPLNLRLCGPFVSGRLDTLERTLSRYREAKSSRKREEVAYDLERAKRDLSSAVRSMQQRADEEMRDQQHFHVEGEIAPPYWFSHTLTARVSYRWRKDGGRLPTTIGRMATSHSCTMLTRLPISAFETQVERP